VSSSWDGVRHSAYSDRVGEQETAVPEVETAPETAEAFAFNVVLRLADGERVEAGSFQAEKEAHDFAEELIASAVAGGKTWPRVGDRYLRPETIISIDIEPDAQPRWTGSTGRATTWTGRSTG
jgi:hypothetical protein